MCNVYNAKLGNENFESLEDALGYAFTLKELGYQSCTWVGDNETYDLFRKGMAGADRKWVFLYEGDRDVQELSL